MNKEIEKMVVEELVRSKQIHGDFPSIEHALTVLIEEIEETEEEVTELREHYKKLWQTYRNRRVSEDILDQMELTCTNIIDEVIQVLAMIRKYNEKFR